MKGHTLGLGRRFFFLRHPLTANATATAIVVVAVRAVVIVIFIIRSTLVTLSGTCEGEQRARSERKTYIVLILYNLNI